jgi:hypothetical protein
MRVADVGLELLGQGDDRARAGVVDIAESRDRRQAEVRSVPVGDRDARREHLDERPVPEDRVGRVEQRRGGDARRQRDVDRREQHAVDHHRIGRLPVQLPLYVAGDGRAEAQLVDQELHLGLEVARIFHGIPALALRQGDETGSCGVATLGDRVVPEHPDVMPTFNQRAGDPERRHEVPLPVPGDDQIASHVTAPSPRYPALDSA